MLPSPLGGEAARGHRKRSGFGARQAWVTLWLMHLLAAWGRAN